MRVERVQKSFFWKVYLPTKSVHKKGWWDYCFLYLSKSIAPRSSNLCASKDIGVVSSSPHWAKTAHGRRSEVAALGVISRFRVYWGKESMLILISYRLHGGEKNMGSHQALSLKVLRRDRETPSAKKKQERIWCPYWLYEVLQTNTQNRNASSQASAGKRSPWMEFAEKHKWCCMRKFYISLVISVLQSISPFHLRGLQYFLIIYLISVASSNTFLLSFLILGVL